MSGILGQGILAKIRPTLADHVTGNIGSRRVLEKAGFLLEGILKNNAVKNGQVLNMTMYALTRE